MPCRDGTGPPVFGKGCGSGGGFRRGGFNRPACGTGFGPGPGSGPRPGRSLWPAGVCRCLPSLYRSVQDASPGSLEPDSETGSSKEEELFILRAQSRRLKKVLEGVEKRLSELESEEKDKQA